MKRYRNGWEDMNVQFIILAETELVSLFTNGVSGSEFLKSLSISLLWMIPVAHTQRSGWEEGRGVRNTKDTRCEQVVW